MTRHSLPDDPVRSASAAIGSVIVDDICEWLVDQALDEPDIEALFTGCCQRLHAAGVPVSRAMVGYSTLHPLYRSRTFIFTPDRPLFVEPHSHAGRNNPEWRRSPLYYMITNGVLILRRRLAGESAMLDFPLLEELAGAGLTDYFAYLVSFDGGRRIDEDPSGMIGSWCTDRPAGFTDEHLAVLTRVQRQLAVAMKVRVKGEIADNVLSAYLGNQAGRKVLAGSIRRGDGERIHAIVWYCDLRDSTRLAAGMGHEAFLSLLNDYFECTAGAVLDHGGEVLRFVGDAVLAIFPVPDESHLESAGRNALGAVREAMIRGQKLREAGRQVEFGIGLHIGDVLFGNIGVPSRVEFSVIGPCANEVARIEGLTKTLQRPVLLSGELAAVLEGATLADLGAHSIAGVAAPMRVFAIDDGEHPRPD